MWQEIRSELHPKGLEVVTIALDTGGTEAAGHWIERANAEHPSLIDQAHVTDELFGFYNVPNGVWIDEDGMIVRPAEPASPPMPRRDFPVTDDMPDNLKEMLAEANKIRAEPEKYVAALRDWADKGADSVYALSPDEVVEKSRPRSADHATAAAHFELGQHLFRQGKHEDAIPHWREAHRLDFDNWTYKRQAWFLSDPLQGPTEHYDGDWTSDIKKIGAENYYPALDMP